MKKITTYWLLAAAMTLAGCASDNDIANANDDDDAVVSINATRAAISTSNSSTNLAEGETFCLVNMTRKQLGKTNKYEAVYEVTSTGIAPQNSAKYVVWQTGKDNSGNEITQNYFQAVIPDNAPLSNFTIPTDQSTAELLKSADWQLASASSEVAAMQDKPTLSLNFEHNFSKLHFDVIAKDDATNLTSNSFISVLSIITPYYNSTENTVEAIIDPKWKISINTPIITIKIADNDTLSVPIPSTITAFEAGKQYNFNLSIGHDQATISSVSVTDWTTEAMEKVTVKQIPYVTFSTVGEQGFFIISRGSGSQLKIEGLEYSVGGGDWTAIPETGILIKNAVPFGGKKGNLRLRGKNLNGTALNDNQYMYIQFTGEPMVYCKGDIRTLLDYENYMTVSTANARFCRLFFNCSQLASAPALPATVLADSCYYSMFDQCTYLTSAPALPATVLSDHCYSYMFSQCSTLLSAPALPATVLADHCYSYMFYQCNNLSSVTIGYDATTNYGNPFEGWLSYAGINAASRTLTVKNREVYNSLDRDGILPPIWKIDSENTTVLDENGNQIE